MKDLEINPTILACGYVCGQLVYVFSFRFWCIKEHLRELLVKRFGKELKRKPGEYLRSAQFSVKHYKNCDSFEVLYINPEWHKYKYYLSREVQEVLNAGKIPK